MSNPFASIFNKTKKKPVKELSDINLKEISFVDNPANRQNFVFFKNREQNSLETMLSDLCTDVDGAITERIGCILKNLRDITPDDADNIKTLVLAATDCDAEELSKCDTLDDFVKACTEEHQAGDVVESLSELSAEQSENVMHLLKVNYNDGEAIWPSLTKRTEPDEDDNVVKVNKGETSWPSLLAHVGTAEQVTKTKDKSSSLWPSLTNR